MSLRQILYFNLFKMLDWGETIDRTSAWRYESSDTNFDHPEWAKTQLDSWMEALAKMEVWAMFEQNGDKIKVNPENVKNFLTELAGQNYNDMWRMFGGNTIPQATAIQAALEMQGFDVWTINWIMWPNTRDQIKEFQKKWNAEHPQDIIRADGVAWPETVKRLADGIDPTRSLWEKVIWWIQDFGDWFKRNVFTNEN